ncbi:MAG: hypothetical protein U0L66_08020 [Acutalibacteraceae bacterium]|nr:hypothetical protein [Acutalibacteraceae bacterium]
MKKETIFRCQMGGLVWRVVKAPIRGNLEVYRFRIYRGRVWYYGYSLDSWQTAVDACKELCVEEFIQSMKGLHL